MASKSDLDNLLTKRIRSLSTREEKIYANMDISDKNVKSDFARECISVMTEISSDVMSASVEELEQKVVRLNELKSYISQAKIGKREQSTLLSNVNKITSAIKKDISGKNNILKKASSALGGVIGRLDSEDVMSRMFGDDEAGKLLTMVGKGAIGAGKFAAGKVKGALDKRNQNKAALKRDASSLINKAKTPPKRIPQLPPTNEDVPQTTKGGQGLGQGNSILLSSMASTLSSILQEIKSIRQEVKRENQRQRLGDISQSRKYKTPAVQIKDAKKGLFGDFSILGILSSIMSLLVNGISKVFSPISNLATGFMGGAAGGAMSSIAGGLFSIIKAFPLVTLAALLGGAFLTWWEAKGVKDTADSLIGDPLKVIEDPKLGRIMEGPKAGSGSFVGDEVHALGSGLSSIGLSFGADAKNWEALDEGKKLRQIKEFKQKSMEEGKTADGQNGTYFKKGEYDSFLGDAPQVSREGKSKLRGQTFEIHERLQQAELTRAVLVAMGKRKSGDLTTKEAIAEGEVVSESLSKINKEHVENLKKELENVTDERDKKYLIDAIKEGEEQVKTLDKLNEDLKDPSIELPKTIESINDCLAAFDFKLRDFGYGPSVRIGKVGNEGKELPGNPQVLLPSDGTEVGNFMSVIAQAETGYLGGGIDSPSRFVRTEGGSKSSAYGPLQITRNLARDSSALGLFSSDPELQKWVDGRYVPQGTKFLRSNYADSQYGALGQGYLNTPEDRIMYMKMGRILATDHLNRTGGDQMQAAALWRFGSSDVSEFQSKDAPYANTVKSLGAMQRSGLNASNSGSNNTALSQVINISNNTSQPNMSRADGGVRNIQIATNPIR